MTQCACFIDADNIPSPEGSAWGAEFEALLNSSVRVREAYGAGKTQGKDLSQWLFTHGFEQINAYSPVSGKNTADILMTLAVAELAFTSKEPMRFILATGDSDFAPVLQKLFKLGHEIYLVTRPGHLINSAKSLGIHTITITSSAPSSVPSSAPSSSKGSNAKSESRKKTPRARVIKVCAGLLANNSPMKLVNLAHALNPRLGARWYEAMGYKKLVSAIRDLTPFEVTQMEDGDYLVSAVEGSFVHKAIQKATREDAQSALQNELQALSPQKEQPTLEQPILEQPTLEQLSNILNELYQTPSSAYVLPQIHHAFLTRYPQFKYARFGHAKFKQFITERLPALSPESEEHHARWFNLSGNTLKLSGEPAEAVSTVALHSREAYQALLAHYELRGVPFDHFNVVYQHLKSLESFSGLIATAERAAQHLSMPREHVNAITRGLYQARLFDIQHHEESSPTYRLEGDPQEAYVQVKGALRALLSGLEPLDESSWEALWAASDGR